MNELGRPQKLGNAETLTKNNWFSVLKQPVIFPDGSAKPYHIVSFSSTGVGVVVRDKDRYLLIYQYRFIVDTYSWGIPGGDFDDKIDYSLEDTARRELKEETGYEATSLKHLMYFYPSCGSTNQRYEIFLAESPNSTKDYFDKNEVINIKWFHRNDILNMVLNNQIVDAMALVPLLFILIADNNSLEPK